MDVPIETESPCDLSYITKCLMLPSSIATQWLQLICWDHWRIVWTTLKWMYICIRKEAWEHNEIIMLTSESILVNLLPSIMFYINWKLLVRFMMFKWCSMVPCGMFTTISQSNSRWRVLTVLDKSSKIGVTFEFLASQWGFEHFFDLSKSLLWLGQLSHRYFPWRKDHSTQTIISLKIGWS
jgi:hypothetical protein